MDLNIQPNQELVNNSNINKVNNQNNLGLMDVLMYIGGFSLFLGISYFIFNFWNDLNSFFQVFFTLGVSLIFIFLGIYLSKYKNLPKLGSPILFICYFLFPVGLNIFLSKFGFYNSFQVESIIAICLISSIVFTIIYKTLNSSITLFFSLTYYALFYAYFILKLFKPYSSSQGGVYNILFSSILFFGISGYYLAKYFIEKSKSFYFFINFFAVNSILIGLWGFNYFLVPSDVTYKIWIFLFPSIVLYLIYFSRKVNDTMLKIFSTINLVIFIIYLIYKNVSSQYAVPVVLISLGILLISSGFYYYLKRSNANVPEVPKKDSLN